MIQRSQAMLLRLRESHILAATAFVVLPVAIFVPRAVAVLFSVSAVAILMPAWIQRRWPSLGGPVSVGFGLFFLWALGSIAWSISPGETAKTAVSLGGTFLGGVVLVRAARALDPGGRALVERWLTAGGALGYLLMFVELAAGAPIFNKVLTLLGRPFMAPEAAIYFLNPGLAIAALFVWPWALSLWRRGMPILAVAGTAAVAFTLVLGDADAPRVGLAIGVAMLAAALVWPRASFWVAGAIVGIGVLAAPLLPKVLPPTADLVREAPTLSPSAFHRISIWQVAVKHLEQKPILGYGFDTARALYGKETKQELAFYDKEGVRRWISQYEPIPLHPHNGIIQVWLELGAVGAAIGACILLAVVRAIGRYRGSPLDQAVGLAAFATGLFIASVSFGIWQSWWLCGLWLMGAFTAAVMKPPARSAVDGHGR